MPKKKPDTQKEMIRELKEVIVILERTCRQTLIYMNGKSCLDEYRVKQHMKMAIRKSAMITNKGYGVNLGEEDPDF
ncbi:MAG: hypothetical protein KAH23_09065 [Kiritimatiellae bacterium]|nr:hypothetical protein [Kiritimatiellia bacterium]